MTKTAALAAALLLCVASAAYAGDRDDEPKGGFRVGPLGQDFGTGVNLVDHPSLRGGYGYAYQPRGQQNKRNKSR